MNVLNIREIEKKILPEAHGRTALYQNSIGEGFPGPDHAGVRMWIVTLEPGGDNTLHEHEKGEQFYFVLEGRPTVTVGDETRAAEPFDLIHIPPGARHRLANDSTETCIVQGLGVSHGYLFLRSRKMAGKMWRKIRGGRGS